MHTRYDEVNSSTVMGKMHDHLIEWIKQIPVNVALMSSPITQIIKTVFEILEKLNKLEMMKTVRCSAKHQWLSHS